MIVSVTFRHDTENKRLRRRVNADCQSIVEDVPAITSMQVVFSWQVLTTVGLDASTDR